MISKGNELHSTLTLNVQQLAVEHGDVAVSFTAAVGSTTHVF